MAERGALTPAAAHGPIFIVGAMGSGTTLLRLILDSHDRIAVPQETGFMRAYNAHRFIPFKWSGRHWAQRLGWSPDELDEVMRELYDRLFMRYAETHGKVRWGEKTPLHTWHIDGLARLFPDAVFVAIVRHPAASVASNVSRFWRHPRWGDPAWTTEHYLRYNKEIVRQAERHADRFVVLRYEDLLLRAEPVLRELLDWLGEPWCDGVLAHHAEQAGRGGSGKVEGFSRPDDPIDVSRIDKWTRTLDERTKRKVASRLGRIAEFFGYAADDPAVLEPLHDGSLIAGGADVAARIDRFADLRMRKPGRRPLPERLYHPREVKLVAQTELREDRAETPPPPRPYPSRARRLVLPVVRRLPRGMRLRLRALSRRIRL